MGKKKKNKTKKQNNKKEEIIIEEKKGLSTKFYLLLVGIIFITFGFVYGFKILNVGYTDWLHIGRNSDIVQHYVGWESYRVSDWNFPIGLMDNLSYPLKVSVIYTDSIPLVALFFKLFSFILPKTFNYFGWYGLLCFILQGIFATKIIKKYTNSKLCLIIVSILFIFVPAMLFRMFYHTSLASQWLILLALETLFLWEEYNNKKIYYIWALLAFLISTIHIYFLPMCGVILVGYIILDILNTKKIKRSIILLGIYLIVSLISIYIFGGFSTKLESDSFGFGLYSYNLNGLFNSNNWSVFIKNLPMLPQQYEGFSYLGIGVIILLVISIILSIIWIIQEKDIILKNKNLIIALVIISVISIFIAASPIAYFGNIELYHIKLPNFLNNIWKIFRSTGRLVWPLVYIIMLSSIIIILKRLNIKYAITIILLCTCLQIIDIGSNLLELNYAYNNKAKLNEDYNLYKYEYLKKAKETNKVKLLVFGSEKLYDSDIILYADWAINNNIKVSRFHFARTTFDNILKNNTDKYLQEIDDSKIYIFYNETECNNYKLKCYRLPTGYYLGYINELN